MNEKLRIGLFDWVEASDTRSPAAVYAHKLALAEAADKAGLHAYMLAEHQGTPLSINGAPGVLLSAMIQRTKRLRLGALTFCLPWYDAYRFYNEVCMLDQLSGGRLELGVGRGVSPIESQIFGMQNIEQSREKYREALEVFFQPAPAIADSASIPYEDVELFTSRCRSPSRRSGSRARTASRSSSPRATATTPRSSASWPTASRTSTAIARSGRAPQRSGAAQRARRRAVPREDPAHGDRRHRCRGRAARARGYATWAAHIHHLTRKHGRPDVHKTEPFAPTPTQPLVVGSPAHASGESPGDAAHHQRQLPACVFSFGDLAPSTLCARSRCSLQK
jgi:alkanesulfonate monooxygenase SsuD/methylene tetrahydromethanopterin reductase-like flavin-dependent oxidoreductase (luciferase family)